MKEIMITDKQEKKLELLSTGSEGFVYDYNGEIYKKYYDIKSTVAANKTTKIEKINNLNIDFLVKVNNIVLDKRLNPKGYTMEKVDYIYDMYYSLRDKHLSLATKVSYLKQLQEKVKILHKNGITLGDFNMANFLFENKTDNLKFIDIDNYAIDGLKSDIKPDLFEPYFNNKIGDNNEVNFDKFNFALMAIRILAREKMSDFDYHMIKYSRDLKGDYLKDTYIPRLDVDNEIKEYLFHLISEDKNKEYFNNLDKLKSKESFIKVK